MKRLYTVYDNKTDAPVIVDGTREECIKVMGIQYDTFRTVLWHLRKGHKTRWTIIPSDQPEKISENTFGQRIKYQRKKQGLTQEQLAKKAGISAHMVVSYENNQCGASLYSATCLADALGLSLDYLAGREKCSV